MTDLPQLADSAGQHLAKRSVALRGAIVGAVLYGGFSLELEIGTLIGARGHHSLLGVLAGTLFGLAAGAVTGFLYNCVLRWFARPRIGAHVLAGISAAAGLIAPLAFLMRQFLEPHALLIGTLGVVVFGTSLGTMVRAYIYNRDRDAAA